MATPLLLGRVLKSEQAQIACGIGHHVSASVYEATYQHRDMDGETLPPFTVDEYEPATCVVCGLRLWAAVCQK